MKPDCHILGITQEIRKQLGKTFGDEVSVSLIEDKEERIVELADDIILLFNENHKAKELFNKMSYTHKKEYIRWIEGAKKQETRENRKSKMIRMILDGKKEYKSYTLSVFRKKYAPPLKTNMKCRISSIMIFLVILKPAYYSGLTKTVALKFCKLPRPQKNTS